MAGALVMVIVLVILFPVAILVGGGILAAALGSLLKGDADASNRTEDGPNEYLELEHKEAETGYPRTGSPPAGRAGSARGAQGS